MEFIERLSDISTAQRFSKDFSMPQIVHRIGPLKQKNKQHRTKHRSKRSLASHGIKAKTNIASRSKNRKQLSGKQNRRAQSKQKRTNKQRILQDHKNFSIAADVPVLAALIGIGSRANASSTLDHLRSIDVVEPSTEDDTCLVNIKLANLKRKIQLVCPNTDQPFQCIDAIKASECVIFTCHLNDFFEEIDEKLFNLLAQCCVQKSFILLQGTDIIESVHRRSQMIAAITKFLKQRLPACKIFLLKRKRDFESLMQRIACTKPACVPCRTGRAYIVSEQFQQVNDKMFVLRGIIRGDQLNVNRLLYVQGIGPCRIESVKIVKGLSGESRNVVMPSDFENVQVPNYSPPVLERVDSVLPQNESLLASLHCDQDSALMDYGSQDSDDDTGSCSTLESKDNCDMAYDDQTVDLIDSLDQCERMSIDCSNSRSLSPKRRVTFAENVVFNNSDDDEQSDSNSKEGRDMSYLRNARLALKDYNDISHFPVPEADETLPREYAELSRFEDYRNAVRFIVKSEPQNSGVEIGSMVAITLETSKCLDHLKVANSLLCAYSMYPHEEKMSLCNIVLNRSIGSSQMIKSYQRLVFVAGIRRFSASAVFSEIKTGDKFNCEEFFPPGTTLMASVYAPIMMLPCPILAFTKYIDGSYHLIGNGHLVSCDVRRVILERIVLRGRPYRIGGKKAVVRGMFSNPVDVEHFKSIPLSSKSKRKGKIVTSLGTKGRMKCLFDRPLKSRDVVIMRLYKRIFPKWDFADLEEYTKTPIENCY